MGRWEPGARGRLVLAAVDLFGEYGYDSTTVAQIAERAGVTRSTFFRHFSDKRELLVAGQEALSRLMLEGVEAAPAGASPLDAVADGLTRASVAMGPLNHELGPRIEALVATNVELQERSLLKGIGLATVMSSALVARGIPEPTARLAAEMGGLAFSRGFEEWSKGDRTAGEDLARCVLSALDELQTAAAALSRVS